MAAADTGGEISRQAAGGETVAVKGPAAHGTSPRGTEELLRRSWSEADIRKVLGDNSLRVLAAAEAIAR